jgi:hypothetical protein
MMGRNHVIVCGAEAASAVAVCCTGAASGVSDFRSLPVSILNYFYPESLCADFSMGVLNWWPFYLLCSLLLLILGSLLPDIDSEKSVLGRFLYLPVQHRTWTHSIWFVIPFILLGFVHPVFRFLWIGVLSHILADEFSRGGVCFMYPVHTYKRYGSGAFIARGHKIKLYHTGERSETVCVVVCVLCALVLCGLCWRGWIFFWQWITL